MSRKQIDEMKEIVCDVINFDICNKFDRCEDCPTVGIINALYNAGYRKQSEGEWAQQPRPYEDEIVCSVCGAMFNVIDNCTEKFDYCPNCGAKMKGGAE